MSALSDAELQDLLAGLRTPPPDGAFEARLAQRLREPEAGAVLVRPRRWRQVVVGALAATLVLGVAAAATLWFSRSRSAPALEAERPIPTLAPSSAPTAAPAENTPAPEPREEPSPPRRIERLEPRSSPRPAPAPEPAVEPGVAAPDPPPAERPRLDRLDISSDRVGPHGAPSAGARPLQERPTRLEPGLPDRSLQERGREGPGSSTTDGKRLPRQPDERRRPSR